MFIRTWTDCFIFTELSAESRRVELYNIILGIMENCFSKLSFGLIMLIGERANLSWGRVQYKHLGMYTIDIQMKQASHCLNEGDNYVICQRCTVPFTVVLRTSS